MENSGIVSIQGVHLASSGSPSASRPKTKQKSYRFGRFATLSYLCGTIPAGGVWRDDRGPLLADLSVPTTVVRGDFPGARDPVARTRDALAGLPKPAAGYVVDGARACLPWEQPERCAAAVGDFVARQFGGGGAVALPEGVVVVEAG